MAKKRKLSVSRRGAQSLRVASECRWQSKDDAARYAQVSRTANSQIPSSAWILPLACGLWVLQRTIRVREVHFLNSRLVPWDGIWPYERARLIELHFSVFFRLDALSSGALCSYKSSVYSVNEEWRDGPCRNCTCQPGGTTMCREQQCAPCSEPVQIPGQCCPICKGNSVRLFVKRGAVASLVPLRWKVWLKTGKLKNGVVLPNYSEVSRYWAPDCVTHDTEKVG